ncbi:hypothetical protein HK097_001454, partial [Rhizophlyctis rosea]
MAPGAPDMDRSSSDEGDTLKQDDSDSEEKSPKDVKKPISPITPTTTTAGSVKQNGYFGKTASHPVYIGQPN